MKEKFVIKKEIKRVMCILKHFSWDERVRDENYWVPMGSLLLI